MTRSISYSADTLSCRNQKRIKKQVMYIQPTKIITLYFKLKKKLYVMFVFAFEMIYVTESPKGHKTGLRMCRFCTVIPKEQ